MAPVILYYTSTSPPCRGILLAIAAAGINVDIRETDPSHGDHKKEEFPEMNAQHTIPSLNDNGFVVWESHAIVTYLIDKYAEDDSLYPKDLQKRTVVNQYLHFDNVRLFANLRAIVYPIFYNGATDIPQDKLDSVKESYEFLEKFLGANDWLAGNTYTLADTTIIASVSSLTAFVLLDNYPKLAAWAKRCEDEIPGYETANVPGVTNFHDIFAKYCPKS